MAAINHWKLLRKKANTIFMPNDPLLNADEVTKLLQVHPNQIYYLLQKGLPGGWKGGEFRFYQSAVMRWSGKKSPMSPEAMAQKKFCR
jgi:predicted DNA-binding transcriptional regulator AlpA